MCLASAVEEKTEWALLHGQQLHRRMLSVLVEKSNANSCLSEQEIIINAVIIPCAFRFTRFDCECQQGPSGAAFL